MIIANRRQLLNGNSFILGVSGAGKSFTAKEEMTNIILTDPNADIIIIDPEREYSPLVKAMQGEVIHISATSENHINAMDMNSDYGDGANPVILKSEFILSLCEQLIGGTNLGAKQKSIIDRCTASVYRYYQQGNYMGTPPTLQDFREELLKQNEPEAQEIALAIELLQMALSTPLPSIPMWIPTAALSAMTFWIWVSSYSLSVCLWCLTVS